MYRTYSLIVDPETAQNILDNMQDGNREVDWDRVATISRLMRLGINDFSRLIYFGHEEDLIDGQHRMNAIIDSGISLSFQFQTGWTRDELDRVVWSAWKYETIELNSIGNKRARQWLHIPSGITY